MTDLQQQLDADLPNAINVRLVRTGDPDQDIDFVAACVTVCGGTDDRPVLDYGDASGNGKVWHTAGTLTKVQDTPFPRYEFAPEGATYKVWFWPRPLPKPAREEFAKMRQPVRDLALSRSA